MAIRPDYVTGSLTLTSGSANFTTSGSALQAAAVQAGDEIITRSGNVLIIASITGQNSGTLMQPCPASAAGAGQPLRIRFQPDGSRYQGAARDLIEKLANGNLEAIAGLTSAANKGIMFTGASTAGTFDLSEFARTLLDDTSASAALTTLGASAFGQALIALTGTNGNIPVMTGAGTVASRPIVGPVSGANNALMEWGNNANGFYFRFVNRLQICFNRELVLNQVATYQVYNTWTFPAAFNSYNVSFFGAPRSTGGRGAWASGSTLRTGDWGVLNFSVIASNFTNVDVALNKITAADNLTGTQSMPVHVVAIGFY